MAGGEASAMHSPWLCAAALLLLLGACLPSASGADEGPLECFPTPEFASYTAEAQDARVAFTLKAPNEVQSSAPLSLTTVLDRSGSMFGRKIELLKATSSFLVDKLAEDGVHTTGVFVYANQVVRLIPLLPVNTTIAPRMNQVINSIFAYGQTNLSGGLKAGIQQQKNGPEGFVKNVFLFTDGLPTVGATTTEDILKEVREALGDEGNLGDGDSNFGDGDSNRGDGAPAKPRIKISTFAVGDEIDAELLRAIARVGGGQSYLIRKEEDIPIAFGDALGGLLSIVGEDIDVFFKPINGAVIKTLRSGGNVTGFEDGVRVFFSDLFAEERRDLLVELAIPESVTEVMEIQVAYTDALTQQRIVKDRIVVTLDRTATPEGFGEQESMPVVGVTDTRLLTAEALAEAEASAKSGNATATATAVATATAIVNVSPVKDDPTIIAIQKDLEEIKRLLVAQAVADAQASAASGDATATAEAVATAEAIVNVTVNPVEDDPTIKQLQEDIEEIKALLAAGAIQMEPTADPFTPTPVDPSAAPAPSATPPASDGGIVARQLGTLGDVLTSQRSSVGSTDDPELAVSMEADTEAKKEGRRSAEEAVLEPQAPAPAPGPRSRREGPEDLEEPAPVGPPPMVIQTLTEDATVVEVPMAPSPEGAPGSGLPPAVVAQFESAAGPAGESSAPTAPFFSSPMPSPESPAAAPAAPIPAPAPGPQGPDGNLEEDPVSVRAPGPATRLPVATAPAPSVGPTAIPAPTPAPAAGPIDAQGDGIDEGAPFTPGPGFAPVSPAAPTPGPAGPGPAARTPTAVQPVAPGPAAPEPSSPESTADETAAETPDTDAPTAEGPTAETPSVEGPTANGPAAEGPTTEAPTAGGPAAEGPTAEGPASEDLDAPEPAAAAPGPSAESLAPGADIDEGN